MVRPPRTKSMLLQAAGAHTSDALQPYWQVLLFKSRCALVRRSQPTTTPAKQKLCTVRSTKLQGW